MIDKSNVDDHIRRAKNASISYKAKKKESEIFCDIVYGRTKMEKRCKINPYK